MVSRTATGGRMSGLNEFLNQVQVADAPIQAPLSDSTDKGVLLCRGILVEGELNTLDLPPVKKYLGPIHKGALGEIYGPRGLGKTWFRDALSLCLTRGLDFGPLKCESHAGVLIIDGEMLCKKWTFTGCSWRRPWLGCFLA